MNDKELDRLYQKTKKVLWESYPGTARSLCALDFKSAYQLLVATILSAQCTDQRVNQVTPKLFKRFPTAEKTAKANIKEIEEIIKSTGFYHSKANNIYAMSQAVKKDFNGEVPDELDKLVKLPGVGRKTANVVLSVWFDKPGLPVDTHVLRLSKRIGLTKSIDPIKVELELNEFVRPKDRGAFSIKMILHGRKVCSARKPDCDRCKMNKFCEKNGVK